MSTSYCPPIDPDVELRLRYTDDSDDVITVLVPPECSDFNEDGYRFWWNSVAWPFFDYRYTYAPPSAWLPGNVLLSAVPGGATVPLSLVVEAEPGVNAQANLQTGRDFLETLLRKDGLHFGYRIDGTLVANYDADPSIINWGPVNVLAMGVLALEGAVVIPINPVEAT